MEKVFFLYINGGIKNIEQSSNNSKFQKMI